ncbi:MAG: hypothetical protein DWQ05_02530 [Calditrichaeota bacterium]|nr:MAG: hypothetical protein DWQ05_02530 [Calditrichota bacterium]
MAKVKQKFSARNSANQIAFTKANFVIFSIGLLFLLIGYFALAQGPADSFSSLSVAPVFLVLGYCVVIPLAILYRNSGEKKEEKQGD